VVLGTAWTPISDLYFSGRKQAARWRAFRLGWVGVGAGLAWFVVVMAGSSTIFGLLTSGKSIELPTSFMILWGVLLAVRMWSDSFYTVLQSIGETNILRKYLVCQAFISVVLQWTLGERFGMEGVLVAIILSFALTCVWYLPLKTIVLTRPG
jgi:O-antigen/teichoic acid export membrane protein